MLLYLCETNDGLKGGGRAGGEGTVRENEISEQSGASVTQRIVQSLVGGALVERVPRGCVVWWR